MLGQVTKYGTLPHIPSVSALPGGVPRGPWTSLHHLTPGAVVPSPVYPALQLSGGASGLGQEVRFQGLGVHPRPQVTFQGQGLGQNENDTNGKSTLKAVALLLVTTTLATFSGALFAAAARSSRPTLYPGLVLGGYTALSGLYFFATNGKK